MNVLLTGASGDIGLAIADVFAKHGNNLFLCGYSEKKMSLVEEKAEELEQQYGVKVVSASLDVTSKNSCAEIVNCFKEELGTLDVVINNAGIIEYGLFFRMSEKKYRSVVDCNQTGTFFMMQEAGKIMKTQKSGSIVNVSSVAGIKGCIGAAAYAASKGAVNALTKTAAEELAPYGIRVNAVAPGMISGGLSKSLSDEQINRSSQLLALKRFGLPEEVANAVYFLASPEASYITGEILRVDGGMFD